MSQCVFVFVCVQVLRECTSVKVRLCLSPDHAGWCVNVCFLFQYLALTLVMPSESQQLFMLPRHKVDSSVLQQSREDEEETHCHPDVYGLDIRDLHKQRHVKYQHDVNLLTFSHQIGL